VSGKKNGKTLWETLTNDITHSENIAIHLKGDKYDPDVLLRDYGIKIDKTNQELYKTGSSTSSYYVKEGARG